MGHNGGMAGPAAGETRHFGSIEELLASLRANVPSNPFLGETEADTHIWVRDGDKHRLSPSPGSPFWSPFLYRGQTARWRPCLPGIFRGMPLVDHPQRFSQLDRARCFLGRVRLEEFGLALLEHPAARYSDEIKLVLNHEAVAQHYEIATDRLDFSQDPDVAAFFATNVRQEDGCWVPLGHGVGVLYRLDYPTFRKRLRYPDDLDWVGRQVFPRPGEQKAATFRLPLGRELEDFPVEVFTFSHHERDSERLHEKFLGGQALFPTDVLSELALQINKSRSIAKSLVESVLESIGCPLDVRERELSACVDCFAREFGLIVEDREPTRLSSDQRCRAEAATVELRRSFFEGTRYIVVSGPHSSGPNVMKEGPEINDCVEKRE